jgi:hypothetical protein
MGETAYDFAARMALALDAYRDYVDMHDAQLAERGITREDVLVIARDLDPFDGETRVADVLAYLRELASVGGIVEGDETTPAERALFLTECEARPSWCKALMRDFTRRRAPVPSRA